MWSSYFMSWNELSSFILSCHGKNFEEIFTPKEWRCYFSSSSSISSKANDPVKEVWILKACKPEWFLLFKYCLFSWKILQPKFDIGLIQTARCDLVLHFFNPKKSCSFYVKSKKNLEEIFKILSRFFFIKNQKNEDVTSRSFGLDEGSWSIHFLRTWSR